MTQTHEQQTQARRRLTSVLQAKGWHNVGRCRWQLDNAVFDFDAPAWYQGKLRAPWAIWQETGELITTGETR